MNDVDFNMFEQSRQFLKRLVHVTSDKGGNEGRWFKYNDIKSDWDSLIKCDLKSDEDNNDSSFDNFMQQNQYVLVPKHMREDFDTVMYLPVLSLQPFQRKLSSFCADLNFRANDPVRNWYEDGGVQPSRDSPFVLSADVNNNSMGVLRSSPFNSLFSRTTGSSSSEYSSSPIESCVENRMPLNERESNSYGSGINKLPTKMKYVFNHLPCRFCYGSELPPATGNQRYGDENGTIACPTLQLPIYDRRLSQSLEDTEATIAIPKKKKSTLVCKFCKTNNKPSHIYTNHTLRDSNGEIVCEYLKTFTCPICKAKAHTPKYCPLNTFDLLDKMFE